MAQLLRFAECCWYGYHHDGVFVPTLFACSAFVEACIAVGVILSGSFPLSLMATTISLPRTKRASALQLRGIFEVLLSAGGYVHNRSTIHPFDLRNRTRHSASNDDLSAYVLAGKNGIGCLLISSLCSSYNAGQYYYPSAIKGSFSRQKHMEVQAVGAWFGCVSNRR